MHARKVPRREPEPPCEQCGSAANVVPVVVGLPTPETEERALRGEAKLWGCLVPGELPSWYCKTCKRALDADLRNPPGPEFWS